MNNDIISNLSPEQIKEMIATPGQTFGGSVGEEATSFRSRTHVDISNTAAKGVRPNVPGNEMHDVTAGRITRPSSRLAERLDEGHQEQQAAIKAAAAEAKALEALNPTSFDARIAFLERAVKRIEKSLKALSKEQQETSSND